VVSTWGNPWFPHEPPPLARRCRAALLASRANESPFGRDGIGLPNGSELESAQAARLPAAPSASSTASRKSEPSWMTSASSTAPSFTSPDVGEPWVPPRAPSFGALGEVGSWGSGGLGLVWSWAHLSIASCWEDKAGWEARSGSASPLGDRHAVMGAVALAGANGRSSVSMCQIASASRRARSTWATLGLSCLPSRVRVR
jgi:hypothetical protein